MLLRYFLKFYLLFVSFPWVHYFIYCFAHLIANLKFFVRLLVFILLH